MNQEIEKLAGIVQSVERLAAGPVGTRFFSLIQTDPGVHPAYYKMAIGSFPGVKWPGAWR
jgi:hypothetical protein